MNPNPDPPPADMAPIHFGPCACGRWPGSVQPDRWASLFGWTDCVEWLDGPADLATATPFFNQKKRPHSPIWRQSPPVPGEKAPVRLSYPFQGQLGQTFWCEVPGALGAYNGYDTEADFAEARIVRAVLVAVSETEEPGNGGSARRAVVEVDDVLTLDDLLLLPPRDGPLALLDAVRIDHHEVQRIGPWRWFTLTSGGDLDAWALWREADEASHLLLSVAWGPHLRAFQAGHRLLTAEEIAILTGEAAAR